MRNNFKAISGSEEHRTLFPWEGFSCNHWTKKDYYFLWRQDKLMLKQMTYMDIQICSADCVKSQGRWRRKFIWWAVKRSSWKVISRKNWKSIALSDIFGPIEKQIFAIKVWKEVLKIWSVKLVATRLSTSGHQAHLSVGQSDSCTNIASTNDDSVSNVSDLGW